MSFQRKGSTLLISLLNHFQKIFSLMLQFQLQASSHIIIFFYQQQMIKNQILCPHDSSKDKVKTKLIIESIFDLNSIQQKSLKVKAKLYQDCFTLQFKNKGNLEEYIIAFCFDLTFELIRQEIHSNNAKWNITQCISIKFQKQEHSIKLSYPETKNHLLIWRDFLKTKLNQRGFHQQYVPLKQLGKGYFADVYKVKSFQNDQQFAVKAFNKEEAYQDERGKQGLINQIQILRSLNHPNVVKIHGVFQSKNSLYICLELLQGGDLFEKIKWNNKLKVNDLRKIFKSILQGLAYIHSKGYMHRDLKPQNILSRLKGSNECVIADFGLTQAVNKKQFLFSKCGTPGYAAPEIINLKSISDRYDCSCDMFSLGVIFHILLLNKSPFPGKTCNEVMDQNKLCKFNFDSWEYQKLPPQALKLLLQLLQKDPCKRLTAKKALEHQFFKIQSQKQIIESDQPQIKVMKEMIINMKPKKQSGSTQKNSQYQCDSPLMLSKNSARRAQVPISQNSAKMKMMGSKNNKNGKERGSFENELIFQKKQKGPNESRFKKCQKENHIYQ